MGKQKENPYGTIGRKNAQRFLLRARSAREAPIQVILYNTSSCAKVAKQSLPPARASALATSASPTWRDTHCPLACGK